MHPVSQPNPLEPQHIAIVIDNPNPTPATEVSQPQPVSTPQISIEQAQKDIDDLQKEKAALQAQIREKDSRVQDLQEELAREKSVLQRKETTIEEQQEFIKSSTAGKVESLEIQIVDLIRERAKLEIQLAEKDRLIEYNRAKFFDASLMTFEQQHYINDLALIANQERNLRIRENVENTQFRTDLLQNTNLLADELETSMTRNQELRNRVRNASVCTLVCNRNSILDEDEEVDVQEALQPVVESVQVLVERHEELSQPVYPSNFQPRQFVSLEQPRYMGMSEQQIQQIRDENPEAFENNGGNP